MSKRGRPKNVFSHSNRLADRNNLVANYVQPRLQLRKINTDTLSVHDINTDDEVDLISSPIATTSKSIVRHKPGPKSRATTSTSDTNQLLLSIKADTTATRNEIKATRSELKLEMQQLANRTDNKFIALDKQLAKTTGDLKTLFAKVKAIETGSKPTTDEVELNKQLKLRNNIAIANVPIEANENLFDVVKGLMHAIGIADLKVDELVTARRIHNSRSHLIIAGFRDYDLKLEVMKKKAEHKLQVADVFDLEKGQPNSPIFVNNHLTPFFSNLSYHGRMAISGKQIHSCWMSSRGFLVKLNADSSPTVIKDQLQLSNFIDSNKKFVQKKRDRSATDGPSPTSLRASKIKSLQRTTHSDSLSQISSAAKALNISSETDSHDLSPNQSSGRMDIEIKQN